MSVRMELGSRRTDFRDICILIIFRKPAQKILVWLKSDKDKKHFKWIDIYIYDNISVNSS